MRIQDPDPVHTKMPFRNIEGKQELHLVLSVPHIFIQLCHASLSVCFCEDLLEKSLTFGSQN